MQIPHQYSLHEQSELSMNKGQRLRSRLFDAGFCLKSCCDVKENGFPTVFLLIFTASPMFTVRVELINQMGTCSKKQQNPVIPVETRLFSYSNNSLKEHLLIVFSCMAKITLLLSILSRPVTIIT